MPNLGDYIGQLMSEITAARVESDLESVRVAERYAAHHLLKYMPVPHFRLPKLSIEMMVAVGEIEEADANGPPRGGVDLNEVRDAFFALLTDQLAKAGFRLTDRERRELTRQIDSTVDALELPADVPVSATYATEQLVQTVSDYMDELKYKNNIDEEPLAVFLDDLRSATRNAAINAQAKPPRVNVGATTGQLSELGRPDTMVKLRLTLTEEAFEWTQVERGDGQQEVRLVKE